MKNTSKKVKTKPSPWSDATLPYKVRSNWPKIAEAMAAELQRTYPAKFTENGTHIFEDICDPIPWAYQNFEARYLMEAKFQFDCALFPKLWQYLFERLPTLLPRKSLTAHEAEQIAALDNGVEATA